MSVERTIAFVDLAGFTALTGVHGDEAAADLVDDFTQIATIAAGVGGAELVKTIGDAVMFAALTPEAGLDAVRRLFHATFEHEGFPEPRAGIHHGPVVERRGDYFGATVNLAARVASRAGSGQALVTATILDAITAADLDAVPLGPHQLRNVLDPVELWAIELCATHIDISVDPVCRMRLSCQAAVARVRHEGVEHRFCSLACVAAFAAAPDRYLSGVST
ncbi:MAG: adenylate/guanylate cyclase domain-containing protein [Ilumatobacter sp.]|uniref:adenylate/guanylate cyclase domain-containing protein n=1 Tax=Ilumatobacter sp. TaxID=1967498 RepID=UPI0032998233